MAEHITPQSNRPIFVYPDLPTPPPDQLSSAGYIGSMQQVLAENKGKYVVCEFLIGSQTIVRKEGILFFVGVSYIILYEPNDSEYVVCDFYSLKFVTFLDKNVTPLPRVEPI